MGDRDFRALLGTSFPIHGVRHTCVAVDKDVLLLLQHDNNGMPIQYVTAHHPSWYRDELVWAQGDYFPLFSYAESDTPMADALRDAALAMSDGAVFVAMADDDNGIRCVGVFTREQSANAMLEKLIARNYRPEGLERRLTLEEYQVIRDMECLDNAYWISKARVDRPDRRS